MMHAEHYPLDLELPAFEMGRNMATITVTLCFDDNIARETSSTRFYLHLCHAHNERNQINVECACTIQAPGFASLNYR